MEVNEKNSVKKIKINVNENEQKQEFWTFEPQMEGLSSSTVYSLVHVFPVQPSLA